MILQRENMVIYFLEDEYPLQKNSYKYADIKEAILLRDKLNNAISKFSQLDIDEANNQLMKDVYTKSNTQSDKIQSPSVGYVYLLLGENGKSHSEWFNLSSEDVEYIKEFKDDTSI